MPITGLNWISIVEIQEKKLVDTAYFRVTSLKIFFWSWTAQSRKCSQTSSYFAIQAFSIASRLM